MTNVGRWLFFGIGAFFWGTDVDEFFETEEVFVKVFGEIAANKLVELGIALSAMAIEALEMDVEKISGRSAFRYSITYGSMRIGSWTRVSLRPDYASEYIYMAI